MNDDRNLTSNTQPSNNTRRVPPVGNGGGGPQRPTPATRQVPVQRPGAAASSADASTRQVPVQRPGAAASGADASTRQVPVQRPGAAASGADASTRQVPVQRPGTSASGADASTRQVPVQRPGAAASGADASTRQVPVQRPGTSASSADASTRQVSVQRGDSSQPASTATKQIPVRRQGAGDGAAADPARARDGADTSTASAADTGNTSSGGSSDKKPKKKKGEGVAISSAIKAVIYIVAVLVISVGSSIAIILIANDIYAFVKPETPVEVVIPENADINDIAEALASSGVIKYPSLFKWYASDHNDSREFVAGTYTVSPATDYEDLIDTFKEQIPEGTTWITVPEGFTTDEIIDLMVENGIGTREGYVDVINNYPFDYWFVQELDATDWESTGRIYRLDGYLFPDTYEFYNSSSERTVIGKLLARFNVIYGEKYKEAAAESGFTTDEIITIASMIEKEAGSAADYYLVSSVFHNRLANPDFPKLESDATVLYHLHHEAGERPDSVPEDHETIDTPYNTYMYNGLPPGAIANPSASAINAALAPEATTYYFFVSYGRETYFSSSKWEHDNYIAMIKEMIAAQQNEQNAAN